MAGELSTAFSGTDPVEPHAVDIQNQNEEQITYFIRRMHSLTLPAAGGLGGLDIFSDVESLLDVGGGSGSLSCGIAAQQPQLHSTILDIEPVCRLAAENVRSFELEGRVSTLAADMFSATWPTDQDAVLFGNIFHDWDVGACTQLACKAFTSLKSGGRIMLHEILLDDRKNGPLIAACMSVAMLLYEKGKQYTLAEFTNMLGAAGFIDCHSVPSYGYYHLVVATRP